MTDFFRAQLERTLGCWGLKCRRICSVCATMFARLLTGGTSMRAHLSPRWIMAPVFLGALGWAFEEHDTVHSPGF